MCVSTDDSRHLIISHSLRVHCTYLLSLSLHLSRVWLEMLKCVSQFTHSLPVVHLVRFNHTYSSLNFINTCNIDGGGEKLMPSVCIRYTFAQSLRQTLHAPTDTLIERENHLCVSLITLIKHALSPSPLSSVVVASPDDSRNSVHCSTIDVHGTNEQSTVTGLWSICNQLLSPIRSLCWQL